MKSKPDGASIRILLDFHLSAVVVFFFFWIACVLVERIYVSHEPEQIVQISIVMKLSFWIFWSWFIIYNGMLIWATMMVAKQILGNAQYNTT